ncbi:phosphopantetheine-binding protein [Streptomyces sp. NPDC052299]|uniref:phosphopantetheine-binding protein n=1 Tax=Streptomyces sp. NPDC052299 TaxID=3155054 RepID=UPI003415978D
MGSTEDLTVVINIASEIFDTQVSASDSFFNLGGNSLLAVQMATRLEESLRREVDILDLLAAENFKEFTETIDGGRTGKD